MEVSAPFLSVYRLNWLWRLFAIIFLLFGAFGAYRFWQGPLSGHEDPKPLEMMIGVVFVAAGAGMAIHADQACIRFTIDTIEHRTIMGTKSLPLDRIRGRRETFVTGEEGRTRYLKLEPDDDRLQSMEFSKNYTFDDTFYRWFYSLPDLDVIDKEAHMDSDFGLA